MCIPNAHQRRVQIAGAGRARRVAGEGIGTELRRRGSSRAAPRSRGAQPTDARRAGWSSARRRVTGAREELFAAFGFAPLRYYFEMRRPLGATRAVDRGPLRAPLRRRARTTSRTTTPRAPRTTRRSATTSPPTSSTTRRGTGGSRAARGSGADCSFLVLDGDEIAGYVLNSIHPDDWPGLGFTEGWTHQLGVRRPWRGRGVATVLLDLSAAAFAAEGLDFAALDVDAENPTGALGLYESQGYRRDKTRVAWSLPVD